MGTLPLRIASFGLARARGASAHAVRAWADGARVREPLADRVGNLVARIAGRRGSLAVEPAGGALDAATAPHHLRVLNFNLRGGMGGERMSQPPAQRLEQVAAVIRRHDPDIVTLQEVDDFALRSRWSDNLAQLSQSLGVTDAVEASPTRSVVGRKQSVAVMTFHGMRIERAQNVLLGETHDGGALRRVGGTVGSLLEVAGAPRATGVALAPYLPRNALDVLVRAPDDSAVRVLTTHVTGHLAGDVEAVHARQLEPIASIVQGWRGPALLTGDFNVAAADRGGLEVERRVLGSAGMRDAFDAVAPRFDDAARVTFPSAGEGIDRLYATRDFEVVSARVDASAADASDHWPMVVDLRRRG